MAQPFSRYTVTDPDLNRVVQDIYDKLAQVAANQSVAASTAQTAPSTSTTVNTTSGSSVQSFTQAIIPPSGETGQIIYVSDYDHFLLWDGKSWQWAPGEVGSDYFVSSGGNTIFKSDGTTLRLGWRKCDGSQVSYLRPDGTLGLRTLPNTSSAIYIRYGSTYAQTTVAAVAPTISAPVLTMNSYTPGGTVSQPTFSGNTLSTHQHVLPFLVGGNTIFCAVSPYGTGGSQLYVSQVSGVGTSTTNVGELDSPVSAGTPSGTVSQPTFTGTLATLTGTNSAPTATLGADPVAHVQAILYYRQ